LHNRKYGVWGERKATTLSAETFAGNCRKATHDLNKNIKMIINTLKNK